MHAIAFYQQRHDRQMHSESVHLSKLLEHTDDEAAALDCLRYGSEKGVAVEPFEIISVKVVSLWMSTFGFGASRFIVLVVVRCAGC